MRYLPLIWAALWRKPVEAVLVLLAVTTAFALFGLMAGMEATARQIVASKRMDRIVVNPRKAALTVAMTDKIAKMEGVVAAGAWTGFGGYYRTPQNSIFVDAVNEETRRARSELPLSAAQWDQLFANPTGIFVSRKEAAKLGLKQGDRLPVSVAAGTLANNAASLDFIVLGIVDDEPMRDGRMILGNFRYVDTQRSDSQKRVSFWVAVSDPQMGAQIASTIDRYFANSGSPTASITFRDAEQNMANSGVPLSVMTWGVGTAGLFMILFLVGNAIAQSVRERIPELAVLKTVGFSDRGIMGLVIAEALVPCVLGALLGMAAVSPLAAVPRAYLAGQFSRLPAPALDLTLQGLMIGAAVLLALLGAAAPVLRLRRLNVPDALARR